MVFEPVIDNKYGYHDNYPSSFEFSPDAFWPQSSIPIYNGDSVSLSFCQLRRDSIDTITGPIIDPNLLSIDSDVYLNIELQYEAEVLDKSSESIISTDSNFTHVPFPSSSSFSSTSSITTLSPNAKNFLTASLPALGTPFTTPVKRKRHSNDSDFPFYPVGHTIRGGTVFDDVNPTAVEGVPKHVPYPQSQYKMPQAGKDLPETPEKTTQSSDVTPRPQHVCSIPGCEKRFQLKVHRRRHETTVHRDPEFECSCCKRLFNRFDNLTAHVVKVHLTNARKGWKERLFNEDGTYDYISIALYGFLKILGDMQANETKKAMKKVEAEWRMWVLVEEEGDLA
ncbi:hypothetical protein MMC10_003845 [Thelotrema lepadinum]|nr:hypothetical protein [Thelotrema lepadinum]